MAGFAQLNENNVIIDIVVISDDDILDDNGNLSEELGVARLKSILGQHTNWIMVKDSKPFAQIGGSYDENRNTFIPIKPFPSWILNEDTLEWDAPTPIPGENYVWNEETLSWDEVIVPEPEAVGIAST